MEFSIAPYAEAALQTLQQHGFEAYVVGGAVRDLLRGHTPVDYDIATNARPQDVKALFRKTIPTGEAHGTVTVILANRPIEITTYRVDGAYTDARHPDSVSFSSNIAEDLRRRDFTVNAMAYNGKAFIDLFRGRQDLVNGIIRAVGDPAVRFSEDALRILRAFRFASVLDFRIEDETLRTGIEKAPLLQAISRERIFNELTKTLCGRQPQALQPLLSNGGLLFLGLQPGELAPLAHLPQEPAIRYAAFCRLCSSSSLQLLPALRAPKKLTQSASAIETVFSHHLIADKANLKQQLAALPQSTWRDVLLAYCRLNNSCSENLLRCMDEIIRRKEPYTLDMLAIGGKELQALGIGGCAIGHMLQQLLDAVISDPKLNQKDRLIELAKKMIGS